MNTRDSIRWFWLAAVCLTFLCFANKAATQSQIPTQKPDVKTDGGLTTVTFYLEHGDLTVNLPDDIRAGDTISGTVVAEPKGQTKDERAKNQSELNGLVIEINDKIVEPFTAPPAKERESVIQQTLWIYHPDKAKLRPNAADPKTATPKPISISLERAGSEIEHATIPIEIISLNLQSVAPLNTFQLPAMGQQGRPIVITGPFDGNAQNTTLSFRPLRTQVQDFEKNTENVSAGFGLLAESPRKAVFQAPSNFSGSIELNLKEGNVETRGTYRNVGVNLSAPKTNLLKGEKTTLTVEVNGLQGIKQPVPLTLTYGGVIVMEGGPYQPLLIQPSQVGADGRYSTTRGITGIQTGGWNATATVVTTRFDFCLQDDSNPRTVILINTFTGEYIFPQPSGANLGGSGSVTRKDCVITLTDNQPDRKVQGKIDPCTQTGGASVQLVSPKVKFTITDRNTRDNTCACGPGCK
ncbi:MAG TPA: hypothetical protein VEM96_12165 [Pyrinomonadaceae bacterium]|nr:hypothetical protein [Pyrinomonadaceae bacterium]